MRYWKRLGRDGSTTTVESYSHSLDIDGAVEIPEAEFRQFISSLPDGPTPVNWPDRWQKASTAEKKLELIAEMLGLNGGNAQEDRG